MRKYTFNLDFFEIIDSEEKAYWLGFLAADGCLDSKRPRINLSQAEKDLEHLEKFKKALNSEKPLYKRFNKKYNTISYRLTIYSYKMYNDLLDKGITPRKSLTLKPPVNVKDELIKHWIRGYFDGDGSVFIRKDKNTLRFGITGTSEVLEFINLQSNSSLRVQDRKVSKAKIIQGSYSKAIKFLHYIYDDSNIFLERKKFKFLYYVIKKVA